MSIDPRVGRNDPCPCGSGKKYKKCCYGKVQGLKKPVKIIKTGSQRTADQMQAAQEQGDLLKQAQEKTREMVMNPKFWQLPKFGPDSEGEKDAAAEEESKEQEKE